MSWPNFYNHAKASAYRYALTTTESGGSVIAGDYTVSYTCEWKFKGTNEAPGASMNIATAQGTAAFKVAQGCSDTLPIALSTISLPDLFVLSVPEFLAVTDSDDCDNVETILETAFRKYDTSPLDGTLHASEWEKAFLQHDVSTRYVKSEYNSDSFTLSQVINSAMLPLVCEKAKDGFSSADVYFESITYPDKYTLVFWFTRVGFVQRRDGKTHRHTWFRYYTDFIRCRVRVFGRLLVYGLRERGLLF